MMILFYISLFVCICYLLLQLLIIIGLQKKNPPKRLPQNLPNVSVLVAARNEGHQILACLQTLSALDYPIEKTQILIGNDASDDHTEQVVVDFIAGKTQFECINITSNIGKAKGKANVLAQLAHKATGDVFFITDADIQVKPSWIKGLLKYVDNNHVMVSGFTVVRGGSFFARMQQVDWLYFMGILQALHRIGFEATAVGNNMLITKKAYFETGGYEHIDFSITEDYKLYKEIKKRGYQSYNVLDSESINTSNPLNNLDTLLHQRKRWITGALELPVYWWFVFIVFGLFVVCGGVVLIISPWLGLGLLLLKFILQFITISQLAKKCNISLTLFRQIAYEFYLHFVTLCSGLYFILPIRIKWKNRQYQT